MVGQRYERTYLRFWGGALENGKSFTGEGCQWKRERVPMEKREDAEEPILGHRLSYLDCSWLCIGKLEIQEKRPLLYGGTVEKAKNFARDRSPI